MTVTSGKVLDSAQVEPVRWTVEQGRFLLRSEHTGGLFSLVELSTGPGGGPPAHVHQDDDETFYVLAGSYQIRLGDRFRQAGPGTVVYAPRRIPHGFRNLTDQPARMLCIATPGGVEQMFEELAAILAAPGPADRAAIAALVARNGIEYLEPGR